MALLLVAAFAFTAGAQSQQPKAAKAKVVKKGNVYLSVENPPGFLGGLEAFFTYLQKSVKYPAIDRENNTQGKVFVRFIIEPNGKVTKVDAVRGPSETLKAEAVRVMQNSPNWKPGKHKGKPVRTEFTVPINFVLG